jgi:hypothetical protein
MIFTRLSIEPGSVLARSRSLFPGLALIAVYLPWLGAQPFVGALGAWLSLRADGTRGMRLCAGLFPSIVMLACWGVIIPATAAVEHPPAAYHPVLFVWGALVWVVPAAVALLFGSLPFLDIRNCESSGVSVRT